jgi:thiamine-monophosphate kinase
VTGEFAAIRSLRQRLPGPVRPGEVWIGDDAAVVRSAAGDVLLLAADTVVGGVHADLSLTGLDDLGWKAMAAALSDIAAMGGAPGHALVSVAGPPGTDLARLYDGLDAASREYACPIVGGDLTNAPAVVVTVAVSGYCDGTPVLRSGARAGDRIWVTGPLGGSAAGLRLLRERAAGTSGDLSEPERALVDSHSRPRAQIAAGAAARRAGATAMIDVSDGLLADLSHICEESGVGFRLDAVPVAYQATLSEALRGGEDLALVFCAPTTVLIAPSLAGEFQGLSLPVPIGWCSADRTERVLDGTQVATEGWEHTW